MINKGLPIHWKIKRFEDFLDYIQPTPYIVNSTDYSDEYKTPVLTAGKSFILGNTNEVNGIFTSLPVIIFDDFTTANKFVNFPFKVKSSAMKILRPKDESVNILYVFYYMQTVRITFDTHKRYWISVFSKLPVPCPSSKEQNAIVSKIESLFAELDKGIESLKTAQQQLKVYRQSVLKWAFEGKLTNDNVKDGELPKGWKVSSIGELFEVFIGSTPKRNEPDYWGGQIPWVSSGEVSFCKIYDTKEKISAEGLENTSCKLHPVGTVILAMIGEGKTRGQAAILKTEATHNQNTAAIRVNSDVYNSELLYQYLVMKYEENRKVGSGNNQKALNKERVKSIVIPLIPINEQQKIIQEIESRFSVCDKIEETINQSLQQSEALRQSILKKAFEGKLV